jgi:hypothetical protein
MTEIDDFSPTSTEQRTQDETLRRAEEGESRPSSGSIGGDPSREEAGEEGQEMEIITSPQVKSEYTSSLS